MRPLPLALLLTFLAGRSAGQGAPAPAKGLTLGSQKSQPGEGCIQGSPGSQFALFLPHKKPARLSTIRSASFFIDKNGTPTRPFRVHLYKASSPAGEPGPDLFLQPVVVSAAQGGKWFTVDLRTYAIAAPQEGFFVAMEWVVSGDKFFATNFMDDYTPYGQIMRPTFEFKESRTWNYSMGKGWSLITAANSQGLRYNAMIKAEVDMIK